MSKKEWHKGLSEKQRRFCEAYAANGGNATKAAETASYKQPHVQGSQNLEKLSVKNALEALRAETTSSAIASIEEIQGYWSRLMRKDPEGQNSGVKASELLAKAQGGFIEKHEHSGEMSVKFNMNYQPPSE